MTWEDILKVKASMTNSAKRLVDEVMDSTPRPINAIIDLMYEKIKERRITSRRDIIPTRQELAYYLARNYNSKRVSKKTGKEIRHKGEKLYFR